MATPKNPQLFSFGTLDKDATLFFNEMENHIGASRLQHTSSMMELPTNFLRDVFRERDEEYDPNKRGGKKKEDDLKALDEDCEEFDLAEDEDVDDDLHEEEDIKEHQQTQTNGSSSNIDSSYEEHKTSSISISSQQLQGALPVWTPIATRTSASDADKEVCDITFPALGPPRRRSNGLTELAADLAAVRNKRPSSKMNTNLISIIDDDQSDDLYSSTDDEYEEEEEEMKHAHESSSSHTLSLNVELWNNNLDDSKFEECTIRFEEDEVLNDGSVKLQNATQFQSLQFFFQFVYDRFHSYSQFILDTSLPTYSEWKKMRKVRIRNASLKTVDYALKGCILSVDIIKAVVRNCLILCFDESQTRKEFTFRECLAPHIKQTRFAVGDLSILAAFDLFDNGSSASTNDWNIALSQNEGIAQKLASALPDLSHLQQEELRRSCLAFHHGKSYKFNIISEFLNSNAQYLKFGAGSIEWKIIKTKFVELHGANYNNNILRAFDAQIFCINPQISAIAELMSDKNDKYVSKKRIIAEPIMWLFYMVSFLIQRQEKLQQLYITAMSYTNDLKSQSNTNSNKQKLGSLVTNLAKQAKDESERLRAIMAKLPSTDDLKQTLIQLVKSRKNYINSPYVESLNIYKF